MKKLLGLDPHQAVEAFQTDRVRKHDGQHAGRRHQSDRRARIVGAEQFQQFLANALGREGRRAIAQGVAGGERRGVGLTSTIPGQKPEKAEDAQGVLVDPGCRFADEHDGPGA